MRPHLARRILFSLVLATGLILAAALSQPADAAPTLQGALPPYDDGELQQGTSIPNQRPQILIESYSTSTDTISPGQDFDMYFTLRNAGGARAENIALTFTPGDLIPRATGGVLYESGIDPGGTFQMKQPLTVSNAISGGGVSNLIANVTYSDGSGNQYTGTFNLAFHVNWPNYAPAAPTKTPTPQPVYRPHPA